MLDREEEKKQSLSTDRPYSSIGRLYRQMMGQRLIDTTTVSARHHNAENDLPTDTAESIDSNVDRHDFCRGSDFQEVPERESNFLCGAGGATS